MTIAVASTRVPIRRDPLGYRVYPKLNIIAGRSLLTSGPDTTAADVAQASQLLLAFTQLPVPLTDASWIDFAGRYGVFGRSEIDIPEQWLDQPGHGRAWWVKGAVWPNWRDVWEREVDRARRVLTLSGTLQRAESLTGLEVEVNCLARDLDALPPHEPVLAEWLHDLLARNDGSVAPIPSPLGLDEMAGVLVAGYVDGRASHDSPGRLAFDASVHSFRRVPPERRLLGTIWMLIDELIRGDVTLKPCAMADCRNWVAYTPDARTGRRQFCSVNCRNRAAYGRHQHALELARDGATTVEIAAAVGSAPATVERWLRGESSS